MVRLFSVWTHFHPPLEQMLLIQCQVNLKELICGSKMNSTISKPEPYGGGLMSRKSDASVAFWIEQATNLQSHVPRAGLVLASSPVFTIWYENATDDKTVVLRRF